MLPTRRQKHSDQSEALRSLYVLLRGSSRQKNTSRKFKQNQLPPARIPLNTFVTQGDQIVHGGNRCVLTCFKTPRVARRPENWTDTYTKHMSSMHVICFFFFNMKAGHNWTFSSTHVVKNVKTFKSFLTMKNKLLNTLGQAPRPALLHINIRLTSADDDDDQAASKPRRFNNTMMSKWTQSVWQQSNEHIIPAAALSVTLRCKARRPMTEPDTKH